MDNRHANRRPNIERPVYTGRLDPLWRLTRAASRWRSRLSANAIHPYGNRHEPMARPLTDRHGDFK